MLNTHQIVLVVHGLSASLQVAIGLGVGEERMGILTFASRLSHHSNDVTLNSQLSSLQKAFTEGQLWAACKILWRTHKKQEVACLISTSKELFI